MKLGQLAGYKTTPLIVTDRYEKYMLESRGKGQSFSPEALAFMAEQLGKPDRDRRGSFSASSLGSCGRQQQFTYLGMPQLPESPQKAAVLANGTYVHLRWQMIGMDEGFMPRPEVPLPQPNVLGMKGTTDGELYEGSLVEIKSTNSNGYRNIMQFGAKSDHIFQLDTYLIARGINQGVFIYENKDTQDYKEIFHELDKDGERGVLLRANWLQEEQAEGRLIPMLDGCKEKKGWVYNFCRYRKDCPLMKTLEQAREHAA